MENEEDNEVFTVSGTKETKKTFEVTDKGNAYNSTK